MYSMIQSTIQSIVYHKIMSNLIASMFINVIGFPRIGNFFVEVILIVLGIKEISYYSNRHCSVCMNKIYLKT